MNNPLSVWRSSRNPLRDLSRWDKAMDRLLEDVYPTKSQLESNNFSPACEVAEDKNHFYFKFELPGMTKEQIKIEIHENELTVTGERKEEKKEDTKRYHYSEMTYGNFLRTFTLPSNIDAERVEAKFDNGMLTVAIAKTEASRARSVNIK